MAQLAGEEELSYSGSMRLHFVVFCMCFAAASVLACSGSETSPGGNDAEVPLDASVPTAQDASTPTDSAVPDVSTPDAGFTPKVAPAGACIVDFDGKSLTQNKTGFGGSKASNDASGLNFQCVMIDGADEYAFQFSAKGVTGPGTYVGGVSGFTCVSQASKNGANLKQSVGSCGTLVITELNQLEVVGGLRMPAGVASTADLSFRLPPQ